MFVDCIRVGLSKRQPSTSGNNRSHCPGIRDMSKKFSYDNFKLKSDNFTL